MAPAFAVAVLHAVTVVLLLTGALLALRYRRVLLVHAPVAAAVTAVHVAGADCPLTTWERRLRARSGQSYDGGFLDHYVFGPLRLDAAEPAVQLAVYALVVLPNILGYALLAVRGRRRASVSPARVSPGHHGVPSTDALRTAAPTGLPPETARLVVRKATSVAACTLTTRKRGQQGGCARAGARSGVLSRWWA